MAKRRRTTTPAVQESLNLALLNALQDMREDVRKTVSNTSDALTTLYQLNILIGQYTKPILINNFLSGISNEISTTNMGLLCNKIDTRLGYNAFDTRVVAL